MKFTTASSVLQNVERVYLVGIGGAGMSGLARLLRHAGYLVSGSDAKASRTTQELRDAGISVHLGQEASHIGPLDDLVIYSSAIRESHVEMRAAKALSKRIAHRAEVLSSVMNTGKTFVAVTGTHGKTTTTSMISFVLADLGKDPTCLVGGDLIDLGTNAILGRSGLFVAEVDESDQSHELFLPHYAIVTNLEEDHMDHYGAFEHLRNSFRKFLSSLYHPGVVIYCEDDLELRNVVLGSSKPRISYGFSTTADFSARHISRGPQGTSFDLYECGFYITRFQLSVLGLHNVSNALAAIALLTQLGAVPEEIKTSLVKFRGAKRRLEVKWQTEDLIIINDYAHHPTEVQASIRALKDYNKELTVIFQPHRYSRTRNLFKQFGRAFDLADRVILTDIYGAGEENPENVSVTSVYEELIASGHPAAEVVSKHEIIPYLMKRGGLSGVVAFLGAGDIGEVANEFADRFKNAVAA